MSKIYSLASQLYEAKYRLASTAFVLEEAEKQFELFSCLASPNSQSEREFVQLLEAAEEEALNLADRVECLESTLQEAIEAVG